MRESQIAAASHTTDEIFTHQCFPDIIPQKADAPLFSPCNLYSPRQSWSVLILECLHSKGNKIGQPSKVLTLWANWFHRCYDSMVITMVITICQNSSWIGKQSENPATFSSGSRKKWNWNTTTTLTAFHSSNTNAYSTFSKFLKKLTEKNQQKSLASRSASRLVA